MAWSSAFNAASTTSTPVFVRPKIVVSKIDWARLVVIDFETHYDADYTLRKLSTSEYVRDPRFKAHMMGIKAGNRKRTVVPGNKIKAALQRIDWKTHDVLCHNTNFDGFILSHHFNVVPRFYFDTLSMARGLHSNDIGAGLDEVAQFYQVGNKLPNVLEQSKGVHNLPEEIYDRMAEYCGVDVDLTLEIFRQMVAAYPADELKLIDLTVRMFCDPVLRVDIPRVKREYEREINERETLMLSIVDVERYDQNALLKSKERLLEGKERRMLLAKRIIGSNERFAELLRAEGIEPPVKISPAWMKKPRDQRNDDHQYAYAFARDDQDFVELPSRVEEWGVGVDAAKLAARQVRLQNLVDCRLSVKSTTNITKAERFLKAGENGLPLPMGYAYARAHTLRWGGSNKMNMQALIRGGELRQSILAPKGHQICVADSGQIEARVNAWLWGQTDLLEAFRLCDHGLDRDVYCRFGDIIYNRRITEADVLERFVAKTATLGLGFGMGALKFQATLAKGTTGPAVYFDLDRCQQIVNAYRRKNNYIVGGWSTCTRIIEDMAAGRVGYHRCLQWEHERIWLPNGLCMKYPNLEQKYNEDKGWTEWTYQAKGVTKKLYGGLLCENLVQCLSRLMIGEQMLAIAKKRRIVMTSHDEIITVARTAAAPACFREMLKAMSTPPRWCADLPLAAKGGFAENYSK